VYSGRRYCLSLPLSSMSAFMGEHGVRCFEFPVADGRERRLRGRLQTHTLTKFPLSNWLGLYWSSRSCPPLRTAGAASTMSGRISDVTIVDAE